LILLLLILAFLWQLTITGKCISLSPKTRVSGLRWRPYHATFIGSDRIPTCDGRTDA